MTQFMGNSVKQKEIILLLFKTRGADANQIIRALYGTITPTNKTKIYELLKKLEIKKFIEYTTYKSSKGDRRFYYLSKQGLERLYADYDIEDKQKGTGLYGDWGHFIYYLYKPPLRNIQHYLMCVDLMIDIYQIIKQYPDTKIDFAHNLYAANKIVKPDFIITKGDSYYFAEVDRLHERGKQLNKKFACYSKYFKSLIDEHKQLPTVIYFIVPNPSRPKESKFDAHQQKRYENVVKAFIEECKEYANKVDVCFVTINEFKEVLQNDFFPLESKYLLKYVKMDIIKFPINTKIYSRDDELIRIENDEKTLYICGELNVQRTKKWFRMLEIQNEYSIKESNKVGILGFEDIIHEPIPIIFTQKQNLKPPHIDIFSKFNIKFVE